LDFDIQKSQFVNCKGVILLRLQRTIYGSMPWYSNTKNLRQKKSTGSWRSRCFLLVKAKITKPYSCDELYVTTTYPSRNRNYLIGLSVDAAVSVLR